MEFVIEFFKALIDLSNAMAIFILFGLLFAGVLHTFVPESLVTKHLGDDNFSSVLKATFFGIPLPVCSCGVIPLASSIKKSGASKGATLSFLISTPITGVDSIFATYGMFGWIFTIYRAVTSMIIAIFAGVITNIVDDIDIKVETQESSCCSAKECCSSKKSKVRSIFEYAFVTLLGDIASALFWGLIVGALITVLMPDDLSALLNKYHFISYILVLIIAIPMYVCATASLPIAASLMLSGVSAGAAFVFLSAGPATNTVTIGVVKKMLGSRALYIYLSVIAVGSILFGLGLDLIFDKASIDPKSLINMGEDVGVFSQVSSIILWGFLLYFMAKPFFSKDVKSCCSDESCS
jgi:uncharacterized membrane protein YraQ (UPF0718 family)